MGGIDGGKGSAKTGSTGTKAEEISSADAHGKGLTFKIAKKRERPPSPAEPASGGSARHDGKITKSFREN